VSSDRVGESIGAVRFALQVAQLRQAVRKEQKQVARVERHLDLIEDFAFANAERKVVAVHDLADRRIPLEAQACR